MPGLSSDIVRFGAFEVSLARAELRKQGLRIRLQEQPFQLLSALLEHPGEVVSREELIHRLWRDGTVVDYDRGLNAAVTRLRQALSDSADAPRYIETVARRGDRFIGQVEKVSGPSQPAAAPQSAPEPAVTVGQPARHPLLPAAVLVSALLILFSIAWSLLYRGRQPKPAAPPRIVPLTTGAGVEQNPSFSPDGTQVVYESNVSGRQHLYLKVVGPGDPTPLTSGAGAEYGPAWSRDGRLIAFLGKKPSGETGVFVIPPIGGVPDKVADVVSPHVVGLQFYRPLDWASDNRHLIVSAPKVSGGSEGLLLISIDDRTATWLTDPGGDPLIGDREPAVSPDGRTIAFARGDLMPGENLYLLPLTAKLAAAGPARRLGNLVLGRSPVWTPDGKQIIYMAQEHGIVLWFGGALFGVEPTGGSTPRPLFALGRGVASPAISAKGAVAYSTVGFDANIWRQQIPARGRAAPTAAPVIVSAAVNFNADYSPDGLRIAFASSRSGAREIWTADPDGGHSGQVTKFNDTFITGSPRWSPDGKQIAFDSAAGGNSAIYVIDAQGGTPRRLTDDRTHGVIPNWSRDGKWIYFASAASGRNEIWKIPSGGGQPAQVTRNGGWVAIESPDSSSLYYTKTEQNATLFRCALDGSGETEILRGVESRAFVVAPDRIYYVKAGPDGNSDIHQFVLSTREDSLVASTAKQSGLGLSLSPDGRSLLFSERKVHSNLFLAEGVY